MLSYTLTQARRLLPYSSQWYQADETTAPDTWGRLGYQADALLWGEYVGKKKNKSYLVGFDPAGPAFKCTCPSPDKPCKHAIGLLHQVVARPADFADLAPPPKLAAWLQTNDTLRQKMAALKAAGPATPGTPAYAAALTKLAAVTPARRTRMAAGVATLATWLEEQVAAGLAHSPPSAWDAAGARLVDEQLPGLALRLFTLSGRARRQVPDWPALLAGLGQLYSLTQAWRNLDALPPDARLELLRQAGVTLPTEELLLVLPAVADEWQVLSQTHDRSHDLTAHRTWLYGRRTGRYALTLHYSTYFTEYVSEMQAQGTYTGELAYYPGLLPQRAALGAATHRPADAPPLPPSAQSIAGLLAGYAQALGASPWLVSWPVTVGGVVPARLPDGRWALHAPAEGVALPLHLPPDEEANSLLHYQTPELDAFFSAVVQSDGQPVQVFGEWNGNTLRPLRVWADPAAAPAAPPAATTPLAELKELAASTRPPTPSDWGGPWPALTAQALAGTGQNPAPPPALPGPALQGTPAQVLLQAAGRAELLQLAGFQPPPGARPVAPFAPTAEAVVGPPAAPALFAMSGSHYSGLADAYVQQVLTQGRVLPPAVLVPLLNDQYWQKRLGYPYTPVLGERGHWLMQQRQRWAIARWPAKAEFKIDPSETNHFWWWKHATPAALREFVSQQLTTRPAEFRQLVATNLGQLYYYDLENALPYLTGLLPAEVAAAMETILQTEDRYHAERRQVAARYLVRQPGSALQERLWQRARPLLAWQHPPGSPPTLTVKLPTKWDASWLADGIPDSDKRKLAERGPELLGALLQLLPPSRWAAHFHTTPAELLTAAAATPHAETLLRAWTFAAALHRDQPVAEALLLGLLERRFPQEAVFAETVVNTLPGEYVLDLLFRQEAALPGFPPHELSLLLHRLPKPLPPAFTELVLRYLAAPPAPAPGEEPHVLQAMLGVLPDGVPEAQIPLVLTALDNLLLAPAGLALYYVQTSLHLRQQLTASLA